MTNKMKIQYNTGRLIESTSVTLIHLDLFFHNSNIANNPILIII